MASLPLPGSPSGKRLEQLKVTELKDELRKRGLSPSGVKKDLVERLKQRLSQESLEEPPATQRTSMDQSDTPQEPSPEADPVSNLAEKAFPREVPATEETTMNPEGEPPVEVLEAPSDVRAGPVQSDGQHVEATAVSTGHAEDMEQGPAHPAEVEQPAPEEPAPEKPSDVAPDPASRSEIGTAVETGTGAANDAAGILETAGASAAEDPASGTVSDIKAVPSSDYPPADGPVVPVTVSEAGLEPEAGALAEPSLTGVEMSVEEAKPEGEPAAVSNVAALDDESMAEAQAAPLAAGKGAETTDGEDKDLSVKSGETTVTAAAQEEEEKVETMRDAVKGPDAVVDGAANVDAELPPVMEQAKGEDEEMATAEGEGNEGGLLVQLEAPELELPDVEEQETQKVREAERLVGQKRHLERKEPQVEGRAQETSKRIRRWTTGREGGAEGNETGSRRSANALSSDMGKGAMPPTGQPSRPAANRLGPALRAAPTANGQTPKERTVPPSREPPSASVRVDNLVRPFVTKYLQELLGRTGKVEKFWIDQIKTHCYATYSSVEEATATREALYNVQWPEQGGKLLTVRFVPGEEVDAKLKQANGAAPVAIPTPAAPPARAAPVEAASGPVRPAQPVLPPPPPRRDPEPELPTLDDLFRKTKAKPEIYFLPLTDDQVAAKLSTQQKPFVRTET